jgi:hypothetical protein
MKNEELDKSILSLSENLEKFGFKNYLGNSMLWIFVPKDPEISHVFASVSRTMKIVVFSCFASKLKDRKARMESIYNPISKINSVDNIKKIVDGIVNSVIESIEMDI